jgi:phenylpropionate dioxygenase-like ring-hydroxylating dioxygenase large terminal subunit
MKAQAKGVGRDDPLYAFTIFVRPCMNIFARYDLVQPITYFPLGPDKTEVSVYTLFPAVHFARPDFEANAQIYRDFIRVVIEEDRAMLDSLQRGLKSRRFVPGPTVALEMPIHHMLNRYLDRMFGGASKRSARRGNRARPQPTGKRGKRQAS